MKFLKGQRVQHKDETYACYGTVVGYDDDKEVLVLWDDPEGGCANFEPSPHKEDDVQEV